MFFEAFGVTLKGVIQIFLLGVVGYFLVKKNILGTEGLNTLSRLVVEITLPLLIFSQLVRDFSFSAYPDWWVYPLLSAGITAAGLLIALPLAPFVKGPQRKAQFLSLVAFQNSGYLPLGLIAAILPPGKADTMLVYLFLFLLGFNFVVWSAGAYMLTLPKCDPRDAGKACARFKAGDFLSPPVVATFAGLAAVFFGLNSRLPELILKPLKMTGDCTLPLALFVVGGNLAKLKLAHLDKKSLILLVIAKMFVLPAAGLLLAIQLKLPELVGLLVVMQLAMPSATSLSVIIRRYQKEDLLISQGVLASHLVGIITIPLYLSFYFLLCVIQ